MVPINIWSMYFASLVGIRLHPKNMPDLGDFDVGSIPEKLKSEILCCAALADIMSRLTENRIGKREGVN